MDKRTNGVRFIPNIPSTDIKPPSESNVHDLLKGLGDGYTVFHSVNWLRLRPARGESAKVEGEADFVIIHPKRGLMIVEVKGGQVASIDGKWYVNGKEIQESPFRQARESCFAVLKAIEETTNHTVNKKQFVYGHIVVFTDCWYRGHLPPDAKPITFVNQLTLSELPQRIESAFKEWARGAEWRNEKTTDLNDSQIQSIIDALAPKLIPLRVASAVIRTQEETINEITQIQQENWSDLLDSNRILVEGVAGSGKTNLALNLAITQAKAGKRVLLLCFNKELSAWLNELAVILLGTTGIPKNLIIKHFHGYAKTTANIANISYSQPPYDPEGTLSNSSFYDKDAPNKLQEAITVLRSRYPNTSDSEAEQIDFDSLIIDEAQDFLPNWWNLITTLADDRNSPNLYIFIDQSQNIRRPNEINISDLSQKFTLKRLRLVRNCRNTKSIAIGANKLLAKDEPLATKKVEKIPIKLLPRMPFGELPELIIANSDEEMVSKIVSLVSSLINDNSKKLKPTNIALIGPNKLGTGSLKNPITPGLENYYLTTNVSEWRNQEINNKTRAKDGKPLFKPQILVTTVKKFKGLEADCIIIYDLENFSLNFFDLPELFVAWTRAKHFLYMICKEGPVANLIKGVLVETSLEIESPSQ